LQKSESAVGPTFPKHIQSDMATPTARPAKVESSLMENEFKTQCPHCGTQFKLTAQHMAQAGGMVRCGSCLEPFQAKDHLIDNGDKPAQAAPIHPTAKTATAKTATAEAASTPPPPVAPKVPASSKSKKESEDWARALLEEEGLDAAQEANPEASEPPPQPQKKSGSHWQMPDEAPDFTQMQNDDVLSLGEEAEISEELSGIETGGFGEFNSDDFSDIEGAGHNNQSMEGDESWAEALLKDAEKEEKKAEKPSRKTAHAGRDKKPVNAHPSPKQTVAAPASLFDFDESELDVATLGGGDRSHQYQAAMANSGEDTTAHLIKWGSLSLLLIAIFAIQVLIFNFKSLARDDGFRPFYQQVCQLLSCKLPEVSDISHLQATNLLVRSLDGQSGVLLVDLLLHNQASHAQPFPRLELTFSNNHDKLLAGGIFSPKDYLENSLSGMKMLPAQSQVHLSFRINDPGQGAKDYSLHLLPPGNA
jgi:predicted Zn finger-like uncharacterized protein